MNDAVYNACLLLSKLSLPVFFSDIVVVGRRNVPSEGACIIVGNHPNEFIAKAPLFKGVFGTFLRCVGAVPVVRTMDIAGDPDSKLKKDNAQLEQESFKVFDEGRAMCVFPEGTSHSESHILHLKDGTSWLKFDYFDKWDGQKDIPIIPCGITYTNKHKWRSQVVVHYGNPVFLNSERLAAFRKDKKTEVKKLTSELEGILYSLTLNAPDWETFRLLNAARRIYMSDTEMGLAEYVEVTRRFSDFYYKGKDIPEVQQLRDEIADYQNRLDRLHLRDVHVREEFTFAKAIWRVLDRLFFLLILLPLAIPGFVLNFPLICLGKAMNYATPYTESKATLKLFSFVMVLPVVYILLALLLAYFVLTDISFLACLLIVVLLGLVHVRILEEEVIGWRSIASACRFITVIVRNNQREELKKLKVTRALLETKLTRIVDKYATPEQKTLALDDIKTFGATKKLVPTLIRRNSYSETFL